MSDNNIIHRDLKLENILVKYDDIEKTKFTVKLTDFGVSRQLLSISKMCKSHVGTVVTMAPEILEGEEYNSGCDLWSLGVIIYQLYFKKYPYNSKTEIGILNQIKKCGQNCLQKTEDEKLDNLIIQLLKKNPKERLKWSQYFNHPFFINQINLPSFDIICKKHSEELIAYCSNCKCNICEDCLDNHPGDTHKVIFFTNIGLSENENKEIDELIKEIEININSFNQIKKLINNIKSIQDNN